MTVDVPQARDLNIPGCTAGGGCPALPKIGRVRSRWTTDLRVGKHAGRENRITGARLVKDVVWHIAFRVQSLEPQPESH